MKITMEEDMASYLIFSNSIFSETTVDSQDAERRIVFVTSRWPGIILLLFLSEAVHLLVATITRQRTNNSPAMKHVEMSMYT